jgi:hypothetical protein
MANGGLKTASWERPPRRCVGDQRIKKYGVNIYGTIAPCCSQNARKDVAVWAPNGPQLI